MTDESELSNLEPVVETVPNEDAQSETDRRMSEMLGFKIKSGIEDAASDENDSETDEVDEGQEGSEEQAEQQEQQEQQGGYQNNQKEDDFWGSPDESGSYKLTPEKIGYLKSAIQTALDNANERDAQNQAKINAYMARLARAEAYIRNSQQQQTPAEQPKTTVSMLEKARQQMIADMAPYMGDEDAKAYADNQVGLMQAAIQESSAKQMEQLNPLLARVQENVYKEDVSNIIASSGAEIAKDLDVFHVPPEECYKNVADYVEGYTRSFYQHHGRRPTQNELYSQLMRDRGKLSVMTLSEKVNRNMEARRAAEQQNKVQPQQQPSKPVVKEQTPPVQPKSNYVPSTVAAQKRVTTGENLRMANDANLMGTPSAGEQGNPDYARMARILSEQNGGGKFTF